MPESVVIEHCSPTLAGIKTGNMFSVRTDDEPDIDKEIRRLNRILEDKGLAVIPLRKTDEYTLVYVYRPGRLKKDLNDPKAQKILSDLGYTNSEGAWCLAELVKRMKDLSSFPHEVGLFLGYPPSDVECFMKGSRAGVKCCGCWKAYSEPESAQRTFRDYERCKEMYLAMHKKGKTLAQLAVVTDKNVAGHKTEV
ncbi:MAG: DUF3793 family protein [Lachnospiraceae bacterium]|nr:DUF3793 family protein [Lachnospiraceae bacterium]